MPEDMESKPLWDWQKIAAVQHTTSVQQTCRHRMAKVRWGDAPLYRCRGCGQEMDRAMMAARATATAQAWSGGAYRPAGSD